MKTHPGTANFRDDILTGSARNEPVRHSNEPVRHSKADKTIVPANQNFNLTGVASGLSWELNGDQLQQDALSLMIKRGCDIVLSLIGLILLGPLLLIVAFLVKTTSAGPVFFVQQRPGLGGASFPMLKFRTMFSDMGDISGVRQTRTNDPRVTPLGYWLRKTSIDELPQLVNILAGHMSIVGPRPHPYGMFAAGMDYRELVPYYHLRYAMRPGLSGWAQVNGLRGPTTDAAAAIARIDHDLAYIRNFSLALDLKIILGTAFNELRGGTGS